MKKRVAAIFISFAMALSFVGCTGIRNKNVALGETFQTAWFYMNVKSATKVPSYGSYTAEEGNTLIDVVIYLENTFTDVLTMSDMEFYLNDPVDSDYIYVPIDPESIASEDVAPAEFTLAINGKAEYHFIYQVPSDVSGFSLNFRELYEDNSVGNIYHCALGM